ncbi:MAG TPA: heme-binding protein [Bryocella sp.]|nr:heme-binding protein [Bryocella sp.]
MAGKAIGGIIVFAGGLPLYAADGRIVGGLGLSGDTSCTDHVIAEGAARTASRCCADGTFTGPQ